MDEDQQWDVGRQLSCLRVWVVDRPDLGVGRRTCGVRHIGGVLTEQTWVGRLGWSMLVLWSGLDEMSEEDLTIVLALRSLLYDAPHPESGNTCCRRGNHRAPSRGKRWDFPWCYRHFMC